MLTFRK